MIGKIKDFANDVVKEMKKVSWPTRDQLKELTIVVIITTILFTFIVLFIDKIMDLIVKIIFA